MTLDDIRDQPVAVRFLKNLIATGRAPNGLLFHGPSGVGKRLTALAFAKALMCPPGERGALAARKIDHGNHPDLHAVVPVKKSRIIDVEAIDGVIELASLRPMEATSRVFLLHDAERMRGPAQNHLLKTLEEPLGRSVFILLTEHPQFLLPTIRSRCQRVRFGRLAPDTVCELLQRERDAEPDTARAIAALAQGQMTRAFDFFDTEKREVVLDVIFRLRDGHDPLALAEEFSGYLVSQRNALEAAANATDDPERTRELSREDREQLKEERAALLDAQSRHDILEVLYLFETWYRDCLIVAATGDTALAMNRDQAEALQASPDSGVPEKLAAIEKARIYLERFLTEERVFRDLFFALAP